MNQFSTHTITEAIETNQRAYLSDYGRCSLIELHSNPAMLWFTSRMPQSRLNRIIQARFDAQDAHTRIKETLQYFTSQNLPLLWHTGPSSRPHDLDDLLIENGMERIRDEAGMACIPEVVKLSDMPEDFFIREVTTIPMLLDWSRVFTQSYNLEDPATEMYYQIEAELTGVNFRRLFLGYYNEQPVSSGTLFIDGTIAGIYAVGTLHEFRTRGFGRAMTEFLISAFRDENISLFTLHASPMGLGIYQKIGFKRYCKLRAYSLYPKK